MAYIDGSRTLEKVGIVGSGQIGPDIALHMNKVMEPHGVGVVVVDIAQDALDKGRAKLEKKLDRGVETRAFSAEQAAAMKTNITFTSDYDALDGASFVIEAATEDLGLKRRIFADLERRAAPGALFASNSSHLEPERIFADLEDRSRSMVIHYFFPAERNPVVEVVPAADTDDSNVDWVMRFYEAIGKLPLRIGSRYGYAIDPIFEGLFQAAALCVEEGLGSTREVDFIARKALGLGVGPFTAMNLTGGNPITAHGLDELHERAHAWFRTPELMKQAMRDAIAWDVPGRGERIELAGDRAATITDRMRGAYFGLVGEVLDSGISDVADLELGAEAALVVRPPFAFMNELGVTRALELIDAYRTVEPTFPRSKRIVAQAESGEPWHIPYVLRRDMKAVAVLTIRRPTVLNALNDEVYAQIEGHIDRIEADDSVVGCVITGFGRKAFVSGADIEMLAKAKSAAEGERMSQGSHAVMNRVEACRKPVVCAYNGLAFGGGNELGLACHARIARKGLPVLAGQPEPNLGIIPGAGATQRLPRVVGVERAWRMLRSALPISSAEGLEMGLIQAEVEGDLVVAALDLVARAASGRAPIEPISSGPLEVPDELPDVDLRHLSKAVDATLQKAVREGLAMPLAEGLRFESRCFGEVCELEDKKIGIDNFLEKGPRSKAEFVHR